LREGIQSYDLHPNKRTGTSIEVIYVRATEFQDWLTGTGVSLLKPAVKTAGGGCCLKSKTGMRKSQEKYYQGTKLFSSDPREMGNYENCLTKN
jgi:hypothetical protein